MNKKIKICIIVPIHWSAHLGGIEYQVKLLLEKLVQINNFEIYYLTRDFDEGFQPIGYTIIRITKPRGIHKYALFLDTIHLLTILNKIQPDIIYQNGGCAYTGIASFYAKLSGCKLIWHIASDNDLIPQKKINLIKNINHYIDRKFLEYGIKTTKHIIAQTQSQFHIVKRMNKKADIQIIKNFHPLPKNADLNQKKNLILWIANFKPLKRPEIFIDLAISLNKIALNAECIMIGKETDYPKNYQESLNNRISTTDNLIYVGKISIDEVNSYLEKAIVFVNTSLWEGFPNTFIQAWMRKVAVVSLHCDPDKLLSIHHLGIKSGNQNNLLSDVKLLLRNKKLRKEYTERAYNYSLKHYSEANINTLIRHYFKH